MYLFFQSKPGGSLRFVCFALALDKKIFFIVVLAILVFAPWITRAETGNLLKLTPQEKQWLDQHPVVLVASDPHIPPIEWIDSKGVYSGIAAEFLKLIQKKTGLQLKIIACQNWPEALEKARTGQVDMLSAAAPTVSRSKYLLFSEPYLVVPGVIITRVAVSEQVSLADFHGMRVSVVKDFAWQEYLKADYPGIQLDLVADVQTGLRKVAMGMSDAFVENLPVILYHIEKEGITNLKVAGTTDYYARLCFASRKDWPELHSIIQKSLQSISPDQKEAILGRWVRLKGQPFFRDRRFWIIAIGIVVSCGLILFFVTGGFGLLP